MPTDTLQQIDPNEFLSALERKTRTPLRKQSEVVSYYKRPTRTVDGKPAAQPGWVMWADTQPGKRDDYFYRGFLPLFKYGRIWDGPDRDGELYRRFGPWGPILSKPGGPAELPLDQIITYRWYRPDNVGSPAQGFEPMSHVRFPQLSAALKDGLEIREYLCPECEAIAYLQPIHLARHLRNSHDWDRADILSWGTAIGIDFGREFRPRVVKAVDYDEYAPEPEPEQAPTAAAAVPVETVRLPGRDEVKKPGNCYFCARTKSGGPCKKHAGAA